MKSAITNDAAKHAVLAIAASLVYEAGISLEAGEQAFRKAVIEFALTQVRGNQCKVARMLGIHRNTLNRMMHLLSITSNHDHWKELYRQQHSRAKKFTPQSASAPASGAMAMQA